jgi:hypothetical protein
LHGFFVGQVQVDYLKRRIKTGTAEPVNKVKIGCAISA